MKKIIPVFLLFVIVSCENKVSSLADLKSDFYEVQNRSIRLNDTLTVNFGANQDKIDSVSLLVNGNKLKTPAVLDSLNSKLGLNQLEINVYTKDGRIYGKTKLPVLSPVAETPVKFEVIREYPHNKELFTEGFFFYDDKIFESSGLYKKSKLVSYKLGSADYLQHITQDDKIFSEGAALLGDKIYQLTYRERKVFVYDSKNLQLLETLQLPAEMREGWGMSSNGKELIAGDGSQQLFFFGPDMKVTKIIQVVGNVSIYDQINELEFINGKIYANVWQTPYVLVINPDNGRVEQYYDLKELNQSRGADDVLNGIAVYKGNLLVTGKHWDKIYELNLPE